METLYFIFEIISVFGLWITGLSIFVVFFMYAMSRRCIYEDNDHIEEGMSIFLFGFAVMLYFLFTGLVALMFFMVAW